jgi:flavin reductase (DIM6/NTAB) family NADH-FMN oxidoreductase RutF
MATTITYSEQAARAIEILSRGAFLTAGSATKYNTMTIGWGTIGFMWGKPIFTVMVRPSRYTFAFLESTGEFTVSLPLGGMQAALNICGTQSGRDTDKLAVAGLKLAASQKAAPPVVAGCGLYYECKVVYKQAMLPAAAGQVKNQWYPEGNYHTLYYGEIVAAYMD